MYYNKDLFDQAGIPYPSGDWTWEEFIASARKLTKFNENGAAVQFGVSGIGGSWQYLVLAAQSGAEIFDPARSRCLLGSRQAIAAAKFLKRLRDEERICPNAAEAETTQPMAAFQIGRAAMHISGQWLIPELRNYQSLRWSAAPMPRMKTGPSRTYMGVHAFVISAQTKNPDAAWKFVRYTVSEKAQRQIASLRINMPVLQRIAYSEEFADDPASPDEGNRVGLEARKNAFTIPSTPACPVTMIKTILDEELDRMYENVGTSTPEQAMGEVARRIDLELKRK
jgi:multiple sugar transport system substrate-binding protein